MGFKLGQFAIKGFIYVSSTERLSALSLLISQLAIAAILWKLAGKDDLSVQKKDPEDNYRYTKLQKSGDISADAVDNARIWNLFAVNGVAHKSSGDQAEEEEAEPQDLGLRLKSKAVTPGLMC